MFGSKQAKKAEVLSHWYSLVDQFNISGKEFYSSIERELERRKVPGLTLSRVIFSEGGSFSANRQYLRMKRERLVFDICAAPFGTSYFFSMRFAELPAGNPLWKWIAVLAAIVLIVGLSIMFCGIVLGSIVGLILALIFVGVIASTGQETYYRQDTRLMYLEIVNAVVRQCVAGYTSASGINLLTIKEHSPLMVDLYKTTRFDIQPTELPAEQVAA